MIWVIGLLAIVAVLVFLTRRFGRRRPITADEVERQRRQLGINDTYKRGGGGYAGPGGGG